MYRLTRDDGAEFRVNGGIWEAALELAFLYGWRPAGTESPLSGTPRGGWGASGPDAWDSHDYFSHESQHVGRADARALAEAVFRALRDLPDLAAPCVSRPSIAEGAPVSPIPSQASAIAAGLSVHRRKAMRRFAAFADCGGFVIGVAV